MMADGRLNKCKECTKRDVARRYYSACGNAACKAYERKRHQTPERRKAKSRYAATYRSRNPEKRKAQHKINNGIRDGKITRQPCEICGAAKAEAHHDDYGKPLDVRWLCFRCHREHAHGQIVGFGKSLTRPLKI